MREDELIEQIKWADEAGKAAGACRLVAQLVYPLDQRVQMGLMKNIQVIDDEIQTDRTNNYSEHQSELSLLHDIDGRGDGEHGNPASRERDHQPAADNR